MAPLQCNWPLLAVLAALLAGCGEHAVEGGDCPAAQKARSVSGFCVPRWVSLKHGEVMARKGPGKDYPAQWIYKVKGLPVQVVAETEEWRRVCDPGGGAAWVNRAEIDGRRTIMSLAASPAPMRRAPAEGGAVVGLLNPRALAALGRCQGGWCKVKAGGVSGWLAADQVWGLAEPAQCR
ncbi:MAG TPA: SH3 domain-containing protein [Caulobacteraceae bacterium]|jgi:SH3-like domain-containing protein|nr:SH3 domain-containing protein [Caulobacteraceae bacterium]